MIEENSDIYITFYFSHHLCIHYAILSLEYPCGCSIGIPASQMEKLRPREMTASHEVLAELRTES